MSQKQLSAIYFQIEGEQIDCQYNLWSDRVKKIYRPVNTNLNLCLLPYRKAEITGKPQWLPPPISTTLEPPWV